MQVFLLLFNQKLNSLSYKLRNEVVVANFTQHTFFHSIFSCCLLLPQFYIVYCKPKGIERSKKQTNKEIECIKKKRSEHRAAKKNTKKETENPKKICLR